MILTDAEAADFFPLVDALDAFVNRKLRVVPGLDTPASVHDAPLRKRYQIRARVWENPALLDDFVRDDPFGLPAAALRDAQGFRRFVAGKFYVERILKKHAIFVSTTDAHVYAVQGLTDPIDVVLSRSQPVGYAVLIDCALLPFRGRIVWDGVVGVVPVSFGAGIRRGFKSAYADAKRRGAIVEVLDDPATRTKPTPRPSRDWRPELAQIRTAVEGLGRAGTGLETAAFGLLKRTALLAEAAAGQDREAARDAVRAVERALRKVIADLDV